MIRQKTFYLLKHHAAKKKCFSWLFFQCPPCRAFTPELVYTYEKLKSAGKKFEVVFVSSDRSEEWFNQYASTMPWLSVPYTDTTRLQMLKTSFGVDGMSTLNLLVSSADNLGKQFGPRSSGPLKCQA